MKFLYLSIRFAYLLPAAHPAISNSVKLCRPLLMQENMQKPILFESVPSRVVPLNREHVNRRQREVTVDLKSSYLIPICLSAFLLRREEFSFPRVEVLIYSDAQYISVHIKNDSSHAFWFKIFLYSASQSCPLQANPLEANDRKLVKAVVTLGRDKFIRPLGDPNFMEVPNVK